MKFSILHISDLHQDLNDEIPNTWLIDSLSKDIERWTFATKVNAPSLCIVSGDIVYGASPSSPDAASELSRQYALAFKFLAELCDRHFLGQRDRIVLLPGNHDIEYIKVRESGNLIPIPSDPLRKRELVAKLFQPNSNLRWAWGDLAFFEINDGGRYANRLLEFARLYERFYEGRRTYSLDARDQFDMFDFPDLSFSLAALNSCHNNDPLNRAGSINPDALAAMCRAVSHPSRSGWIVGAAWHHNIQGAAGREDFLDPKFLQILIEAGVSLGFHGHQHRAECFDEKFKLGNANRKITVISAGTLCAEPKGLNPGIPRGFNFVEVDTDANAGRVHLRQMINQLSSMPVWGPGLFSDNNSSFLDFSIARPLASRPLGLDRILILDRAHDLMGHKDWKGALSTLRELIADMKSRRLIARCLSEIADNQLTIATLERPQTIGEAVMIGGALLEIGRKNEVQDFLGLPFIKDNLTDASLATIHVKLERKVR